MAQKLYSIEKTFTCPYIGQRNGGNVIVAKDLTLKEAQTQLLDIFNTIMDKYAPNWGIAVISTSNYCNCAYKTFEDGTRRFHYDSRNFDIVLQDN